MTDDTIDLLKNYLLLDPDGTAVLLPGGGDFWNQLMSGDANDSGIRRTMGSEKGRLLSAVSMGADWTHWEMHPAGDEVLFMFEGNGRLPRIGELGEFDQAFTSDSGVPMISVYLLDSAGRELWAADMLESEFVAVPRNTGGR